MAKKETSSPSLRVVYTKLLAALDGEIDRLPEHLDILTSKERVDFITKVLPLVLRYRESPLWGAEETGDTSTHL